MRAFFIGLLVSFLVFSNVCIHASNVNSSSNEEKNYVSSPTNSYGPLSFAFNVGAGFLYFHKIRGNLTPSPKALFPSFTGATFKDIEGFSYNKSPLFEAMLALKIQDYLKLGLSFQTQGAVSIESWTNSAFGTDPVWAQFRANLQLYSLSFKPYVTLPKPIRMGRTSLSPYLSMGVGPCWQSWTDAQVYEMSINNGSYTSNTISLRQKACASAFWTVDLGFAFNPNRESSDLSICFGCKYLNWGPTRNLGELDQQGSSKVVPFKPIEVKNIYSISPYIGIQFNF